MSLRRKVVCICLRIGSRRPRFERVSETGDLVFSLGGRQFAVDKGYDHPDYTDWVYSGVKTDKKGAVTATAATAGDNE